MKNMNKLIAATALNIAAMTGQAHAETPPPAEPSTTTTVYDVVSTPHTTPPEPETYDVVSTPHTSPPEADTAPDTTVAPLETQPTETQPTYEVVSPPHTTPPEADTAPDAAPDTTVAPLESREIVQNENIPSTGKETVPLPAAAAVAAAVGAVALGTAKRLNHN